MDLHLKDKVVIITGGARGIGEACVRAFAEEGAIPVVVDRSLALAYQLTQELGVGLAIEAELESLDTCATVVEKTMTRYGRIDGVVNNAGKNDSISLQSTPAEFEQSLQRNLLHVFAVTHYSLKALIASHGFVINISSKVAETGQGNTSGYAASKGAMNALTREWATDLAQYGIRVNTVVPSEVFTPQYEKWIGGMDTKEDFLEEICSRIPLGQRMTQASEIAWTVVFLASSRSSHTTGQLVYPDGGYVHLDRSFGNSKPS
ncbi:MAG: SDR family oxidoreductase [Akkermansiaceae bacterium]